MGRADAQANRQRLLAAARAVFAERGLDAEMKEIAERAGVGMGTIYRNFATKEDLIGAVFDDVISAVSAVVDVALEEPDALRAVQIYVEGLVAAAEQHGQLACALMSGTVPPTIGQHFEKLLGDTRMATVIERGIAQGCFRPGLNPYVAAAYLRGLADPIVWLSAREYCSVEETQQGLLDLCLRGLLARE